MNYIMYIQFLSMNNDDYRELCMEEEPICK